jgi:NADPH2:quinone reductase
VAGTVAALGEGVTTFDVGERVVALSPSGGAFAERVVVPASGGPAPLGLRLRDRRGPCPSPGLTAVGILRLARVHAGDRVLVTGAAGGVGHFAVQVALQAKATVTGQAAAASAPPPSASWAPRPWSIPGDGSPVDGEFDVVVDGIGGPMVGPLLDATAAGGRVVVYGNSADAESTFRVERFYSKGVTIFGFRVFTSVPPDQGVKDMANLADQAASGALSVKVQATAPLADALSLIRDLYDRKVTGKVVLTR